MKKKEIRVTVKTKKGEVEVPAILDDNGTLNIDLQFVNKDDIWLTPHKK